MDQTREEDNKGVTPVVGIILMVAITVILAAVIGAFVLQLGSEQTTIPNARFNFDQQGEVGESGSNLTISHKGGDNIDNIDNTTLTILVNGEESGVNQFSDTVISAGDSTTISISSFKEGDLVEIRWTSDSGKKTQILQDYELS